MVPTFGIATAKYERPVEAAQDARKTLTRSRGIPTQKSEPEEWLRANGKLGRLIHEKAWEGGE